VRRERGELASPDVRFATKHGEADFAVGDRVQFTETDKKLHIYNGNAGVITGIDVRTGQVTARLDAAAGAPGREVTWNAAEFQGFRHGYAGTIYKGQGKTLDHTYLLHTHHWRAAASYVALTRQRESAQVFVATETARDVRQLARQMARGEVRAASVAWATADELPPALRQRAGAELAKGPSAKADGMPAEASPVRSDAAVPGPSQGPTVQPDPVTPGATQATQARPADAWLIPPSLRPDGRDSLGRGTGAGEIAAAVAADTAVQRERQARWSYLQGAYRDPHAARAALDELVKTQGWTSAASRVAADPLQLGELRGKEGLFVGAKARAEREAAQRAAGAIGPSLTRIGAAEARAEGAYRASFEGQRAADATGVPRLSAAAEAAIGVMAVTEDARARGEAWRAAHADHGVAGELRAFRAAVAQRFGDEGVRAMLRAGRWPDAAAAASITPEQRPALSRVAELIVAVNAGERASLSLDRSEAEGERQGLRRGLRP
jgi:hypothetical protein